MACYLSVKNVLINHAILLRVFVLFNKRHFLIYLASLSLLLAGCSSAPERTAPLKPSAKPINLNDAQLVKQRLNRQYRLWRGTPYKYGGQTRRGVDCSAFVQNTYRNAFGYQLPRTTKTQIKQGKRVSRSRLKPGDIVFFKIKKNTLHNGVYLGGSKFVHASTSKGVTISDLNNVYWKRTYYTARRL